MKVLPLIFLGAKMLLTKLLLMDEKGKMNTEKYEEYRKHAFIMMKMALIEKDAQNQQSAIQIATSGSFWERFPTISGLFLWDILYREHGIDAFHQIYLAGWEGFLPVAES